ncbi:TIGR03618 family F420-dependent PPOX class oxidoreductase [Mycolicibacterium sp. P9-64]|uniref:TIGR03618 family F420-dependent PPOX class oxidoreductase n=1 Tax=Mycolicibacterium sp. P9-64 TaxID=2024612 RepID=UPI0011EC3A7E|nr:TIGR03618 family F420-dependent PPOX class oxidoreductase [Mycolicibacterium sp. P9-64]KAA0085619.1 TIGR03618 family F420-dependent PPOX class oxidoreductase [Mycolicibacterium sp. P9-64]
MKLGDAARALIGGIAEATLVTLNRDGSPQVSVVWAELQSDADGEDELVLAHSAEHQKVRNARRDPRVALTIMAQGVTGGPTPYLAIKGTARIIEGGAPELLRRWTKTIYGPEVVYPPGDNPPAGFVTRIRIDSVNEVTPRSFGTAST